MKPPPDGATLPLSSLEESELLLEELFELLELLELSFWLFEEDVLSFSKKNCCRRTDSS